jgi:hypothetical protein
MYPLNPSSCKASVMNRKIKFAAADPVDYLQFGAGYGQKLFNYLKFFF